MQLHNRI